MEEEEDIFLVIIGDDSDAEFPKTNTIKLEPVEEEQILDDPVEYLLQQASQFDESEMAQNVEYLDNDCDENLSEDDQILTQQYVIEEDNIGNKPNKVLEMRSLVTELRETYPDCKDDEFLVDILRELMRTVKAPELPPNHYEDIDSNGFGCTKCEHISVSVAAAGRHYEESHGPRYLLCYACGAKFRSKGSLYRHERKSCTSPDTKIVLKARALYIGRNTRTRPHIRDKYQAQKGPEDICSVCHEEFPTKAALFLHTNMIHPEIALPYKCSQCPAAYRKKLALKHHEKYQHSGIKYICDYCSRAFKKKDTLKTHINTHLPKKKYACEECPKRYSTKFALNLHVNKIHKNLPPPCVCQVCTKRFRRMWELKEHMKKEHGVKLMTENMLMKRLPLMKDPLVQNAKIVTKEDIQKLSAETEQQYYEEQRQKEDLKNRRFPCKSCPCSFPLRHDLKVHMEQVHRHEQQPVVCHICQKQYARLPLLKKHMKSKHGMIIMSREAFQEKRPNLTKEQFESALVVVIKSNNSQ